MREAKRGDGQTIASIEQSSRLAAYEGHPLREELASRDIKQLANSWEGIIEKYATENDRDLKEVSLYRF